MKSSKFSFNKVVDLTKKFSKYIAKFGFIKGIFLIIRLRLIPNSGLIYVTIPESKYPIIIRGKTTDVYIFEKIFILEDYNLSSFSNFNPIFIIDGGAYVAYSSIFFSHNFPDAIVVAVEPEESNFLILEKNTSQYPNIKRINAGIWNKKTFLKIRDLGVGHYGFLVEEVNGKEDNSIKAITISDILSKFNYKDIDILKLDTEGAEKDIFASNFDDWLSRTKIIIIELHDFNRDGCTKTFYSAINNYNFIEIFRDQENLFFLRTD